MNKFMAILGLVLLVGVSFSIIIVGPPTNPPLWNKYVSTCCYWYMLAADSSSSLLYQAFEYDGEDGYYIWDGESCVSSEEELPDWEYLYFLMWEGTSDGCPEGGVSQYYWDMAEQCDDYGESSEQCKYWKGLFLTCANSAMRDFKSGRMDWGYVAGQASTAGDKHGCNAPSSVVKGHYGNAMQYYRQCINNAWMFCGVF